MDRDVRLGRVAGVPVTLNWSVLVIAGLLTWGLATGVLPHEAPGHPSGWYWLVALAAAVILFGSLLAHELAHAVVARRNGVEVMGITLWLFGGMAQFRSESPSPGLDFRIAAAGPATSIGLAFAFGWTAIALDAVGVAHLAVVAAAWLSAINLMLGVFNLLPRAPLDGGRVLRAFLWWRHGDRVRAARSATRAGTTLAYVLIGLGVLNIAAGLGANGLWLAFIGWFVLEAARAEEADILTRDALAGVLVRDVMTPNPVVAPGWLTTDDFVERYLFGRTHSAYPVEALDGRVAGLVTLAQLRDVSARARMTTRLIDIALPLDRVAVASPDDGLTSVLERLTPDSGRRALVIDHGQIVGIITPADVARAAEQRGLNTTGDLTAP